MSKIRVLPDVLANKIAAGEVVERPASVVKELLENSLDAGAKRIDVEVEAGGRRLIRVTDDGEGMTRDDAILAFERHATSKIKAVEDLEAIATLGFRGEALPSIAAVSKVTLLTKTSTDLEGTEVQIEGGRMLNVKDAAWPGGTEVTIKDIFFNVPARKKFLKAEATEMFHISNMVTHYALANPQIGFSLIHNGREMVRVSPVETLRERAYQLFGSDFFNSIVELSGQSGEVRVSGFISKPQSARTTRDAQYFFVNRRFIRDRLISRAVSDAYTTVLPSGMYPSAIIFLEVPLTTVDVNAHPAKTEVRFHKPTIVRDAVFNAIRDTLAEKKPVASFPAKASVQTERNAIDSPPSRIASSGAFRLQQPPPPLRTGQQRPLNLTVKAEELSETFRLASALKSQIEDSKPDALSPFEAQQAPTSTIQIAEESFQLDQPEIHQGATECPSSLEVFDGSIDTDFPSLLPQNIKPLGQLHDSFIIAVDNDSLLLIDQHAAHERVLFEYFRNQRLQKQVDVQQVLIPETIDLTPGQAAAFEAVQPEIEASGFEIMRLSGRTIAIKAVPAGVQTSEARALLRELLEVVERERRNFSLDRIREGIAASIACRAAIKVNMPLTHEKMGWLIDELLRTTCPTNCPHGRPTVLRFTMREIRKSFGRI